IRGLVEPVALMTGLGPDVAHRGPESERPVTNREDRRGHPAPLEVAQQVRPAFLRLPVAVADRDQLLGPVQAHAHHDQDTQPVLLEPDAEMDSVNPPLPELPDNERLVPERSPP